MDEQELRELFNQIVALLNDLQLSWLVDQVNGRIAEGKVVEKYEIPTISKIVGKEIIRGNKRTFKAVESYSIAEQVDLLLEAVQIIADTVVMESEVTQYFLGTTPANADEPMVIAYTSDESEEELETKIDRSSENIEALNNLIGLIESTRRAINRDNTA